MSSRVKIEVKPKHLWNMAVSGDSVILIRTQFDYRLEHPATQPRIVVEKFAGLHSESAGLFTGGLVYNSSQFKSTIFARGEHKYGVITIGMRKAFVCRRGG